MLATREYRSLMEARSVLAGRLDRACVADPFARLEWLASLQAHCFADEPVRIFQAIERDAECWLFARMRGGRRLSALANWYSFDWAPAFLGNPAPVTQARLLEAIARAMLNANARLDFYPMTETDTLLRAFRRAGWLAVRRAMGGRYLLRPEGRDFATYWRGRPSALRNLVKRKGRGDPFSISIDDRLSETLWADYVDVHARSWKEPEPALPFLKALAERESAAGALRLGFARLNGQAIATQLWSVEGGTAFIHKLSHDRAHDQASPGTLLSHAMFAHAIDVDHASLIDYGTGDNAYKADWMEQRATLYRIDCFNPRFASAWLPAARTAISALVG
ncbi:MAG: GNAT family N-acetyltransferase [Sphingobium sp.]